MTDSKRIRRYKRKRDIVEKFTDDLERVRQNSVSFPFERNFKIMELIESLNFKIV